MVTTMQQNTEKMSKGRLYNVLTEKVIPKIRKIQSYDTDPSNELIPERIKDILKIIIDVHQNLYDTTPSLKYDNQTIQSSDIGIGELMHITRQCMDNINNNDSPNNSPKYTTLNKPIETFFKSLQGLNDPSDVLLLLDRLGYGDIMVHAGDYLETKDLLRLTSKLSDIMLSQDGFTKFAKPEDVRDLYQTLDALAAKYNERAVTSQDIADDLKNGGLLFKVYTNIAELQKLEFAQYNVILPQGSIAEVLSALKAIDGKYDMDIGQELSDLVENKDMRHAIEYLVKLEKFNGQNAEEQNLESDKQQNLENDQNKEEIKEQEIKTEKNDVSKNTNAQSDISKFDKAFKALQESTYGIPEKTAELFRMFLEMLSKAFSAITRSHANKNTIVDDKQSIKFNLHDVTHEKTEDLHQQPLIEIPSPENVILQFCQDMIQGIQKIQEFEKNFDPTKLHREIDNIRYAGKLEKIERDDFSFCNPGNIKDTEEEMLNKESSKFTSFQEKLLAQRIDAQDPTKQKQI